MGKWNTPRLSKSERDKRYRSKNNLLIKQRENKKTELLNDRYIIKKLRQYGLSLESIYSTPQVIELWRNRILIFRELKKYKNEPNV